MGLRSRSPDRAERLRNRARDRNAKAPGRVDAEGRRPTILSVRYFVRHPVGALACGYALGSVPVGGFQGQGVAGQFMPIGAQAPHFPSQQYSPIWQDFGPHATPMLGFETDASCPPLSEPGGSGEENNDELSSSEPHAAKTNVNPAQKMTRIAFTLL